MYGIYTQPAAARFDNTTMSRPVPRKAESVNTFINHYVVLHWPAEHKMSHVSFPRTYNQYQYHSNLNIFICTPVTDYEVLQISCKVKVHIMGEKSFQNMTLHLKKHNICHVYEINILLQAIHSGKYTTADYVRICRENKYSI